VEERVEVEVSENGFVRFEIYDGETAVAFSNPVYFLRP